MLLCSSTWWDITLKVVCEEASELRPEACVLQTGAGEALSAGPGSLYQHPAGKLSVAAQLQWTDSGTGRDGDDKVHRLKWFSSETFFTPCPAHTSLSRSTACEAATRRTQRFRECPIVILILLASSLFCSLWQCSEYNNVPRLVCPSSEVLFFNICTLTTSIFY